MVRKMIVKPPDKNRRIQHQYPLRGSGNVKQITNFKPAD
jgi:hypothetical protein